MSGTTTFYKLHHKLDFSRSCYVGSTSNYAKRIHNHKFNCTNPTSEKYNFKVYQYIRENGGFDDWTFSILEHLETVDKPQRLRMERDFISKHGATLNKQNPGKLVYVNIIVLLKIMIIYAIDVIEVIAVKEI